MVPIMKKRVQNATAIAVTIIIIVSPIKKVVRSTPGVFLEDQRT